MKDEAGGAPEEFEEGPPEPEEAPPPKVAAEKAAPKEPAELTYPDQLRQKFKSAAGSTDTLDDIYVDESWYELLEHVKLIAPLFSAGSLKLCFINRGESNNLIIMPGDEPTVVAVTEDCPRDQVLEALRK
jgi:hypothetical protein